MVVGGFDGRVRAYANHGQLLWNASPFWGPGAHPSRIEAGAVGISTTDLRALLAYYQIEDEKQTEELVELARVVRANRSSHNRNVDAERGFSRPD